MVKVVTESTEGLNPSQQDAVEYGDGALLVIAGAGSGKTRVLTHRIAHLLGSGRARPGEILAITFTNRAAREMRERVGTLVGPASRGMWVTTFHSACVRMLRQDAERLGYGKNFTIYDEADSVRMVKRVMAELEIDTKAVTPKRVKARISSAKNGLVDSSSFQEMAAHWLDEQIGEVYELYEKRMLEANAMDFDDLLVRVVNLLELFPDIRERWQGAFRYVLVDEYQDTNHAQYRLLQLLCGEAGNITVVGDEDQSIYGFRHADIRNILDFERDFPGAAVVKLEQNYRSTQNILGAANAVVENNRDRRPKRLWSDAGDGDPIRIVRLRDEHEEARWVAGEVERLVAEEQVPLDRIAVFYRTNSMSRVLEDTLVRFGTDYQVIGGTKFYDRAEIKDAIAYLQLLVNPADPVAFARVVNTPRRGIGKTSQDRLLSHANTVGEPIREVITRPDEIPGLGTAARKAVAKFAETIAELATETESSVADLLAKVLARTGYLEALEAERSVEAEGRIENLEELESVAAEFDANREIEGGSPETALAEFLQQISLYTDQDRLREEESLLTLMTIHNAKGLEFDSVFIIGCEEGLFPHSRALEEGEEEEERRLCYVGITRAEKRLYLTGVRERKVAGGFGEPTGESRFLDEIPDVLTERESTAIGSGGARSYGIPGAGGSGPGRITPSSEPVSLAVGDDVVHASFGAGVVIGAEPGGLIIVRFSEDGSERKLMAEYAPIRKA
jgi:DNA helicase-2/ATP-dependent DNA helicase PcrA